MNTDHTARSLLPHCTPAGDSSCEYSYLLQPPSDLPCNPFHREHTANKRNVTKSVYSVKLTCVVAQSKNITSSGLEIRWVQMLGDSEPKCLKPNNESHKLFSSSLETQDFILFQSRLQMTKIDPPNGSDSYWCVLLTDDKDIPCNSSNIFENKLTIHKPKFYNMLAPCPANIYFHLAKTVCVTNSSTRCQPNSNCSDESEDDGSEDDPTVIIIVCTSVGALILLTVVVIQIVVCVLIRVKRKSKQHQKRNTSKKTACAVDTYPRLVLSDSVLQLPIYILLVKVAMYD